MTTVHEEFGDTKTEVCQCVSGAGRWYSSFCDTIPHTRFFSLGSAPHDSFHSFPLCLFCRYGAKTHLPSNTISGILCLSSVHCVLETRIRIIHTQDKTVSLTLTPSTHIDNPVGFVRFSVAISDIFCYESFFTAKTSESP